MLLRAALAACVILAVTADGWAQIYAWRDANGTLVLSDQKADPSAATYAVPATRGLRATRPAPAAGARVRYEPLIQTHAAAHRLAPDLLRAVIQVESGFNPRALSPKGAMGLMQLMPATARLLGVSDPWDADQNIRGGAAYLRRLLTQFDNNEELALAAYNAGPDAVGRSGRRVPAIPETQEYVRRVARAASRPTPAEPAPPGVQAAGAAPAAVIYRTVEVVNGRPVSRYSTERPTATPYGVVGR